jgi:hypothetical protein
LPLSSPDALTEHAQPSTRPGYQVNPRFFTTDDDADADDADTNPATPVD